MAVSDYLNAAQRLYQSFIGDAKVATYKAPHAPQPTPKKPRISRVARFASQYDNAGDVIAVKRPRLFSGHRP